jgi:hypothetical protein
VNQHAAVDVTPLGRSSIQSNRLHLLRG